jgi:hypothetical protein
MLPGNGLRFVLKPRKTPETPSALSTSKEIRVLEKAEVTCNQV